MRYRIIISLLIAVFSSQIMALSVREQNQVQIGDIAFNLNLYATTRIEGGSVVALNFDTSASTVDGITSIIYSSPQMDVNVSFSPREQYEAPAWLVSVNASCKEELYLYDVFLSMDSVDAPIIADLKGIEAINSGDFADNVNIIPYRDKAVEYAHPNGKLWIVASGYDECGEIEGLSANQIMLYDHKNHFFRRYVQGGTWEVFMDTMYKPAGSSHDWAFLLFAEKPLLLNINRWPGEKRAALCITNDADGENLSALQAVYEGSSNPENPKYYRKGFFARNIPVSNTVFGNRQATLGEMWHKIKDNGNTIGYHTYSPGADPAGSNQQALITDLVDYDIRLWIDHAVPSNPEDISYLGLIPGSDSYMVDVINASGIDYIWPGDTPYTNPFNAYDEPWRLPHLVYEAKGFTRPIWFFGRTRMEFWDYTNFMESLSFKYMMSADNLDKLIEDRGLHISYTHFSVHSNSYIGAFFDVNENGDYEIKDEVDDMLLMLDYYRQHRGLWIDTLENIFDRMLAIDKVKLMSYEEVSKGIYQVVLKNASDYDLKNLHFKHLDTGFNIPNFAKGDTFTFFTADEPEKLLTKPENYILSHNGGSLIMKSRYESLMPPMKIEIFNIRGQKVKTFNSNESLYQWTQPFGNYASGIYFARVSRDNIPEMTLRFFVVK